MRYTVPVFLWLLLAPLSPSQETPAAERAKLLEDYRQSFSAWQQADALLDDAAEPQELLKLLKDAEAKWSAAVEAKGRYFKTIRPFHRTRGELLGSAVHGSPDSAQAEAAGENTLTDLSTDLNSLDRQLKNEARALTRPRAAALRTQRNALAALQKLYRSRQQALKQARQTDTSLERNLAALAERYRSLAAAVAGQDDNIGTESSRWSAAYEQMRRRAIQQAAASPVPSPAATPVAPPEPPARIPAAAFSGKWALPAPRPEKFSDSAGPLYGDVSVSVQLTQTGDRISGVYSGVVFVPPGEKYNPKVSFRFTGPAGPGPVVEARIDSPLSGMVRLERVDDSRLRISYRIDRTPGAAGVSFKIGELKELLRQE